jgi:hypothetical protein
MVNPALCRSLKEKTVTEDHEYMDTGALTEDAVPQPPVEAPGSPSKAAASAKGAGQSVSGVPDTTLPEGAYVVPAEDA